MISACLALVLGQLSAPVVVTHPPLNEMSGIIKSTRYPDTYWVHNDSGDVARIFAIRAQGSVHIPPVFDRREWPGVKIADATNVDWEDITSDGDNLYIADVGNNENARQNLGIYVVPEPNPASTTKATPTKFVPVRYPDQTAFPPAQLQFDCEAVFYLRGKIYMVTKHRNGMLPADSAKLYRLDTMNAGTPNTLTKLDQITGLGGWVTSAAVSPDGTKLAVLCQALGQSVWLFDANAAGDKFFSGTKRKIPLSGLRQAEGICFDGNGVVVITNEQRDLFRLTL